MYNFGIIEKEKMMETLPHLPFYQKLNYFQIFLLLSSGFFLGFFIFFLINLFFNKPSQNLSWYQPTPKNNQVVTDNSVSARPSVKYTPTPYISEEDRKISNRREAFVMDDLEFDNNNMAFYPEFKRKFSKEKIKDAFSIDLKGKQTAGWIIEVETKPNYNSLYLLTGDMEKELTHAMSSNSIDDNDNCDLKNVQTIGTASLGPVFSLSDKQGYIILSGDCGGYGGGEFVSAYGLTSGEKVKFSGSIPMYTAVRQGVTPNGNALGRLRGIFGINNPVAVIEFGSFESAGSKWEGVREVGFFDLQNGRLKQRYSFN